MRYTSKELSIPVSKLQGFTCSASIRGEWLDSKKTIYGIYSYSTLMVAVFKDIERVFVNRNKYSVTTSKQMGKINTAIRTLGYLIDNITAAELAELLEPTGANVRPDTWATPRA